MELLKKATADKKVYILDVFQRFGSPFDGTNLSLEKILSYHNKAISTVGSLVSLSTFCERKFDPELFFIGKYSFSTEI